MSAIYPSNARRARIVAWEWPPLDRWRASGLDDRLNPVAVRVREDTLGRRDEPAE
jgi:hypothetical protein